jgi:hypothetical protein
MQEKDIIEEKRQNGNIIKYCKGRLLGKVALSSICRGDLPNVMRLFETLTIRSMRSR